MQRSCSTTSCYSLLITYSRTPGGSLHVEQTYSGRESSLTFCSGDAIPSHLACCQVRQESHWSMNPTSSSCPQTHRITSSLTTAKFSGSSLAGAEEEEVLKTTQSYWVMNLFIKTNLLKPTPTGYNQNCANT